MAWGRLAALIFTLSAVTSSTVTANSDVDALSALRRSFSDPDNVLQSWDPNLVNPCTWFHVTCDQDNRVTRLYLAGFQSGIPWNLRVCVIPDGFGMGFTNRVWVWECLNLYQTRPIAIPNCEYVRDLGFLKLSGSLVPELGKMESLQYLELYRNNIQGPIPEEIGNLKNLISLDLYNNNITGKIPSTLANLKSIVFLRLNDNHLTGRIPRELSGVSSLKVFDVSNNDLCGTIPTTGPFEHIPLSNFENNPRLEGPELMGLASYDTSCS